MHSDTTKQSIFKQEIDLFRGFSILLILSSHILYLSKDSFFYLFSSAIYLNSTIYFVFISGFLFQYLLNKYNYTRYIIRKGKNVILPYLICSVPILLLRYFDGPSYMVKEAWPDFDTYSLYVQIGIYMVTGAHLLPFWYLPMITIYFLAAPLFKAIDNYKQLYWLLPILFILSMCFPRGLNNMNNILLMAVHFLFLYVFGMFYSRNYDKIQVFFKDKWLFFVIILLSVFIATIFELPYRNQLIFIQKVVSIPLLLIVFSNVKSPWVINGLQYSANSSFGMYFVHMYFVLAARAVLLNFWGKMYPWNEMVWVLEYMTVLLLSLLSVRMIQKLFGLKSRFLIGS